MRPLQTLSLGPGRPPRGGLLAPRPRGRLHRRLGLVYLEANQLADTLRGQRLGVLEATGLVRAVLAEIDAAVYAFDDQGVLRSVNRGGNACSGSRRAPAGPGAAALGLEACLTGESPRVVEHPAGQGGRWELRRSGFRQEGRPHQLVLLTDVGRTLQAEERQAWQRLVRGALSHEINNSLVLGHWREACDRFSTGAPPGPKPRPTCGRGSRSSASAARPWGDSWPPTPGWHACPGPCGDRCWWRSWVGRGGAGAPARRPGGAGPFPAAGRRMGTKLDQLLINLVQNAVDATYESGGGVTIGWRREGARLVLEVLDEGPGVGETANLFVPFFTTKPAGAPASGLHCPGRSRRRMGGRSPWPES